MRSNGVLNFPDPPSSGLVPKADAQQLGVSGSQLQAAQRACQRLYPTNGGAIRGGAGGNAAITGGAGVSNAQGATIGSLAIQATGTISGGNGGNGGDAFARFALLNNEFHLAILAAAKSPRLETLLDPAELH